jgi:hypothetical protein
MKTVKALTNLGFLDYPDCPLQEGETAQVSDVVAARMVAMRHGEILADAPPAAVEVETKPAPTTAKAKSEKQTPSKES